LYAPYTINKKIFDIADRVVFTSSISQHTYLPSSTIWSTGDMIKFKNIKFKKHKGFNILYIGTLDYSKIHYDYIDVCRAILDNVKDAKFIVCGSGDSEQDLKDRAMKYGIYDKFTFTGIVDNIEDYISISDVFLYLLSPTQFGTCEQVLGETMSSGLIPIVLNNKCESNIVKNDYNGKVVHSIEDCIKSIVDIYNKKDIEYLSQNAKKVSDALYDTNHMINSWNKLLNDVVKFPKKERYITCDYKYSLGMNSFLESIDIYRFIFIDYLCTGNDSNLIKLFKSNYYQWKSKSKGSIKQYLSFFKDDVFLLKLNKVLENLEA
jgi:glycosyltransferase involved in cell wall biosynthesis